MSTLTTPSSSGDDPPPKGPGGGVDSRMNPAPVGPVCGGGLHQH